jgi:uncharacterized membrane protein
MERIKETILDFLFSGAKGYQLRRNLKHLRLGIILGVFVALAFGAILFLLNQQRRL